MNRDKWQKIALACIFIVIGVLLFGARASGQRNDDVPIISPPLPPPPAPTLLQFALDRPDAAASGLPFAPLVPSTAVSRTRVITALADTVITHGYPTANCGNELEMRVGYDTYLDPDGQTLYSLVRFNLASISTHATVHSATLWLFLSGSYDYPGHSVPITPYRISSSWAVDTVTWTSQPSYTESYTPTWVAHGSGTWYPFDVTALVRRWVAGVHPNYGLVLLNPDASNEWRAFATSETIYPPHLIISYEPSPHFTLTIVPNVQAVVSGQSASSSSILYLTATDGFSESVSLDVAGLPPGASHAWSASPVTPTANTLLTVTSAPSTPRGAYTLTITGTAASLVQTTTVTLRVLQPDFEMFLHPPSQSVWSGQDASYTTHLTATDGFTASVALDIGGLPTDTTYEWAANPVTPTVSVPLTLTTAPDTPRGVYTLTITGTAASLVHTAQTVLHVSEPDFELHLDPSRESVAFGDSVRFTTHVTEVGGFSESVTLAVAGLPPTSTHVWSANPVTPTTTAWLTITTAPDTPRGVYTLTITGTAGSRVHTAQVTLTVFHPGFELSLTPSWISVGLEADAVYTTHLTATDGFSESVTLDVDGLPPDVAHRWRVNPVTPTTSTWLTLTTAPDTPRGVYTFTITGTSASLARAAQATLQVFQPDFELSLRPSQRSIWSGQATSYTAHLTATDGFAAGVQLDVGGLPPHAGYAWSANPVTPTVSVPLTITTASNTPDGVYTLTITGTAGSLVHTAQTVLHVSEPDFKLELVPAWLSVRFGSSARYTAYLTATGGFSKSVALSVGQLPPHTTYVWSANPVTPTASAWLTITTGSDTPGGLYTIVITGVSSSLIHTTQARLHISNPDFDLSLAPSWRSVWGGESTQYTALLTATGEFSQSVILDIGELPAHTTYEWAANPVTPTVGVPLTITTSPDTPGGVYTFTITGTANSLLHTAQAVLHVSEPDFELRVTPTRHVARFGESVRFTTYITGIGAFSEGVTLAVAGLPPTSTHVWSANPVTPTATVWLTITTAPDTPRGVYTLTLTGTAESRVHTAQVTLTVLYPGFELSLTPSWISVGLEADAVYTTHLTATDGFSESVTLDVDGLPPDVVHRWRISPVTPTTSTWLTLTTAPDTPRGVYTFTITGTSASLARAAQATLQVFQPDFELSLRPSQRSIWSGQATSYTAHLTATDGFAAGVQLDVGGLPPHAGYAWSANPVTPTATAWLTITTAPDTPGGAHPLTITGVSGEIIHSGSVNLTVFSEAIFETIYLPLVLRNDPTDDSVASSATQDTPVSRIALVIGVADYEHMEPITNTRQEDKTHDLGFPVPDAFDLEGEISRHCDCEPGHAPLTTSHCGDTTMTVLVDRQATKGAIHAAIINWMDPLEDENTLVMISFSGHGMYAPDDDGDENDPYDEFIVPYDVDIDEEGDWLPQTAIRDDELASWLDELESQKIVVFIDSCFAGGMTADATNIKGFSWRSAAQAEITAAQWRDGFVQDIQENGRIVLAATTEGQASWEFGELRNGVFTYYLVEALRTASADVNSNGWISAEEAYNYLYSRVGDYVWNHTSPSVHQNPQISDGVSGEVDITHPVFCDSCPVW